MVVSHLFDLIPIWLLLLATILVMVLFIELGFRLGKHAQSKAKKAQTSQVSAIMGAGLGLLAFMLAFTFGSAQTHFEIKVQSLAEEARIARNAFMQADLLVEPGRSQAKQWLKDYVEIRSGKLNTGEQDVDQRLADFLEVSEKIQRDLWSLAVTKYGEETENQAVHDQNSMFNASVLALTDIHYTRLHSAIMNRIPFTIWMTLYLMAILSMIIMGYQAGLTDRRSPIATITLAVAFSSVITLITDLDRPLMSFFDVNHQLLLELHEDMEADLRLEYFPGEQ